MSKTLLTIGAGPGIGLATARRFAEQGFRVVLAARSPSRLEELAERLRSEGHSVDVEQVDATNPHSVAALVTRIGTDLQVLHYNAGVLHYDDEGVLQARPLESESTETLISDTQVNLTSAMAAIHAAVPLLSGKPEASILLTGGGFGVQPNGSFLTMSVGKAGIRALAIALHEPLKQLGIHVGTVTVARLVSAASPEAEEVADRFWHIHDQPQHEWTVEAVCS